MSAITTIVIKKERSLLSEDSGLNWNGTMQTGSALVTYGALIGAFLAGFSPLEFSLYSAVLLGLWLSSYSFALKASQASHPEWPLGLVVPSLSESMVELHSLQNEINVLQSQFASKKMTQPFAPDDSSD